MGNRVEKNVRNYLVKILTLIGILIMVAVITVTIPFTVPRIVGFQIYEVLTGSMEPI